MAKKFKSEDYIKFGRLSAFFQRKIVSGCTKNSCVPGAIECGMVII